MLIKCNVRSDVGQYKELSMMSYYKMNLDRTVKWIDKTGTDLHIKRAGISSVKLYNTLVASSNIDSKS
jgi:hypothetical protein